MLTAESERSWRWVLGVGDEEGITTFVEFQSKGRRSRQRSRVGCRACAEMPSSAASEARVSLLASESGGEPSSPRSSASFSPARLIASGCGVALVIFALFFIVSSHPQASGAMAPKHKGPQFGLHTEARRDARGSPHSVAARQARIPAEVQRSDELKTSRIREAQTDPTSMFDMSTP